MMERYDDREFYRFDGEYAEKIRAELKKRREEKGATPKYTPAPHGDRTPITARYRPTAPKSTDRDVSAPVVVERFIEEGNHPSRVWWNES